MNATRIRQLAWYLPEGDTNPLGRTQFKDPEAIPEWLEGDVLHFTSCYSDLKFGWTLVRALAVRGLPMPCIVDGDDMVLWRAYYHLQGHHDSIISSAMQLATNTMEQTRMSLEASLLTSQGVDDKEGWLQMVCQEHSLSREVVIAYEKLFFNILDRLNDEKFIRQTVYPGSRLVEMMDDYIQNEGISSIMRRTGYNNGLSDLMYLMGDRRNPLSNSDSRQSAAMLEKTMMVNGLYLARNGWLNQIHNSAGLMHSRQLMQAAKAGGESDQPTSPLSSVGETLMGEIQVMHEQESEQRAKAAQKIQRAENT